jgi:hypothetical protein
MMSSDCGPVAEFSLTCSVREIRFVAAFAQKVSPDERVESAFVGQTGMDGGRFSYGRSIVVAEA